uniref:Potassium channel domain-containing protein n=1 Tax=Timema douglasi TaxID=61478 RepID=A0A7R8VAB9_TIMDO|nr:unnamed protein product [Timema douglasi]
MSKPGWSEHQVLIHQGKVAPLLDLGRFEVIQVTRLFKPVYPEVIVVCISFLIYKWIQIFMGNLWYPLPKEQLPNPSGLRETSGGKSYVCFGALLFSKWENWGFLDGSYFCFISLSTIGFGDIVPGDKIYKNDSIDLSFIFCSMFGRYDVPQGGSSGHLELTPASAVLHYHYQRLLVHSLFNQSILPLVHFSPVCWSTVRIRVKMGYTQPYLSKSVQDEVDSGVNLTNPSVSRDKKTSLRQTVGVNIGFPKPQAKKIIIVECAEPIAQPQLITAEETKPITRDNMIPVERIISSPKHKRAKSSPTEKKK